MSEQSKTDADLTFSDIRLKSYYRATAIVPFFVIGVYLILYAFYPFLFSWIRFPTLFVYASLGMMIYQLIFYTLAEVTRKILFWNHFIGTAWVSYFTLLIAITGGSESPFVYFLVFPILVSLALLDERISRRTGFLVIGLLFIAFFFNKDSFSDPSLITLQVIHVIVLGIIGYFMHKIVKDTLRQKYEKEEIQRQLVAREGINRVKETFLTVMSHQLNTPLSRVRWALSMISEQKEISPENKEMLKNAQKSVEESIGIVRGMLASSEEDVEKYKMAPEKAKVDLAELVRKVLDDIGYLIQRNGVTVDQSGLKPAVISADKRMLHIALTNVLDNAVRYSPKARVSVDILEKGESVAVLIRDTGMGIDPADKDYISDKFFRGKNAISLFPNESGVGLYITKQIVAAHRGTLEFASEKGKGTTVTITLPKGQS